MQSTPQVTSIEESRAKRIEKQKSRYRHRFGTFVPSEHNPLLDTLLARGVNGESPSPQKVPTRSSPRKSVRRKSQRAPVVEADEGEQPPLKQRRASRKSVTFVEEESPAKPVARPKPTKSKGKKVAKAPIEAIVNQEDETEATAPAAKPAKKSKALKSTKTKAKAKLPPAGAVDDEPSPTKRASSSKRKSPEPSNEDAEAGPSKRAKTIKRIAPSKSKKALPVAEEAAPDDEASAKPAKQRKRPRVEEAAVGEEEESAVEPPPKKRGTKEKKEIVTRKRKKVEVAEQSEGGEDAVISPTSDGSKTKTSAKNTKESTARRTAPFPKPMAKPRTATRRFKFPKSTRFSSPLRPVTDDEGDPIDFLS